MSVKKESLFKQKLKKAKIFEEIKEPNLGVVIEIQSFPKVFKIDQYNISESVETIKNLLPSKPQQSMIDEAQQNLRIQQQQSYLKSHKNQLTGVLSQDELNQINNQNWNAVSSMTQQQRLNYINLIQNTLPQHFIDKLKKNKVNKTKQKIQTIQKMVPEIDKIILDPSPNLSKSQKMEQIAPKSSQEQQNQDDSDDHKIIMDQIYLNIKNKKLTYIQENVLATFTQEQKNQMPNKAKIFEMLTAQNNQSQIVGSQLTLMWLKNIFPSQSLVFYVNNIPFHTRIMVSEIYQLLKVIESNIKSTKFYSCYIQMLVKSVEILTLIYKNLSYSQLKQQILFVQFEFQKTQKSLKDLLNSKTHTQDSQNTQLQQKQMLFQSLGILYQSLKQQQQKRDQSQKSQNQMVDIEQKFEKLNNDNRINELIEVILIEQTLRKQEFQKYEIYPSINNFLQIVSAFWDCKIGSNLQNFSKRLNEVNQFSSIFYKLVCKFNKKQKGLPFYKNLVKKIFGSILEVIEEVYLKKIIQSLISKTKIQQKSSNDKNLQNSLKNSIFFQILFVYRQLSSDSEKFATYFQKEKYNWLITEDQASILVYLNFDHYVSVPDLKTQEIKILETTLEWLRKQMKKKNNKNEKTFLNSDEVLISLLKLFLSSQQQVYSLLDQSLLQQVFKAAIEFYESNREKMFPILTENQIKKMVQNYNFNSFGNDIFTKVIFWVAVSISSQIESLIGEEVMMRYPMLFYYACQPIQLTQVVQNGSNEKEKVQSPLLGDLKHYVSLENNSDSESFSIFSNESTKSNLLKLLCLNLDFEQCGISKNQQIRKIIFNKEKSQTQGFSISKNQVNESNYFIRYLVQPFLKKNV